MIELVIKIPEEEYRWIKQSDKNVFADVASKECMLHAIKNGTPLPKGHGRLIDADKLKPEARYIRNDGVTVYVPAVPIMKVINAQTIIEADREESED